MHIKPEFQLEIIFYLLNVMSRQNRNKMQTRNKKTTRKSIFDFFIVTVYSGLFISIYGKKCLKMLFGLLYTYILIISCLCLWL